MTTLAEIAADPTRRSALIQDIAQLIDAQVAGVKGISGMAIRTGYKVVASLKGGRMIPSAIQFLLNDFCAALDPFVAKASVGSSPDLVAAWRGQEREVSQALLAITDAKAKNASPLLQGPYKKLRGFGEAQVAAAVPDIARVLQRYV